MINNQLTLDERMQCLALAVEANASQPDNSNEAIISTAKSFEKYLFDSYREQAVSTEHKD